MSRRFRNLSFAFGVSIALWAVIIQGISQIAEHIGTPHDTTVTASIK
ncbi:MULTISPECIES: hypothetical protein [Rhizobium/Agrobacterium group]|jgi:hypothetical protein|uniref:Uncharacterized protein n=1 Tax=Rhizobium soli TaxID=424798 RepID=A0A7X0MUX9_9HYPH|nr:MULTISPECIES: hypothetical protein [Rhizobium/Agrobacterium group]MBB6509883.1 hypothetical protein [Rhizobium soli]MBD8665496.1 hypothetical protein [Rhizobium sp. CFBP 8752]NSY19388.1 hypothetical protein [Neorhizobium sp. AL 9.2.2]SEH30102.1 hypothetical protein SAMN03159407_3963 [Rhizobium sp. NFR12]